MGIQSSGEFLASPVAAIAAATKAVDGVDFTSNEVNVGGLEQIAVQVEVTGAAAGSSGAAVFAFVGSLDGQSYDSEPFLEVTVNLNGTNTVRKTQVVSVSGIKTLKLASITNNDALNAVNNAFARYGFNH